MRPIAHIRSQIFHLSQDAFAKLAGVTQPTVSRWEAGKWEPSRDELERIRSAAHERGIKWDDRYFFEVPEGAEQ